VLLQPILDGENRRVAVITATDEQEVGALALEGWGQELPQFLDAKATVNNQAIGGRSTGTFMYNVTCDTNGKQTVDKSVTPSQWGAIKKGLKPGDYVLIQFGHNDEADPKMAAYCARAVAIPQYKQNLGDMADIIVAHQATPIFVTPMSRLSYKSGVFSATLTDYSAAMKEEAQIKGVKVVDLNTASVELYRMVGYQKLTTDIFEPGGNTHFLKQGAIEMAHLVSKGIRSSGGGLAPYARVRCAGRSRWAGSRGCYSGPIDGSLAGKSTKARGEVSA
jgi:lysophospholipase L1-like esterase